MNIIETRTKYIYARECDKRVNRKNKKRYEIGKGITAEFYKKHNSNRYDLCNICFDKKEYELMKADMLWSDADVRLVTKQFDWNRKFPPVFFVREFPGGFFVIAFLRGRKKSDFLKKQVGDTAGLMEYTEGDIFDAYLEATAGKDYEDEELAKHPSLMFYDKGNEYISSFMEAYGQDDSSILDAISTLNAVTLAQEGADPKGFLEKHGEQISQFCNFFMENFYTPDFEDKMRYHWGDIPRILRIGAHIETDKLSEIYKHARESLSGKRKRNADLLAGYFLADKEKIRFISITVNNGTDDGTGITETLLPGKEEANREIAYGTVAMLFCYDGACLFRIVEDEGFQVVNGFRVIDGKPEAIGPKELKDCCQLEPDGSIVEHPEDRYQKAFIRFE